MYTYIYIYVSICIYIYICIMCIYLYIHICRAIDQNHSKPDKWIYLGVVHIISHPHCHYFDVNSKGFDGVQKTLCVLLIWWPRRPNCLTWACRNHGRAQNWTRQRQQKSWCLWWVWIMLLIIDSYIYIIIDSIMIEQGWGYMILADCWCLHEYLSIQD